MAGQENFRVNESIVLLPGPVSSFNVCYDASISTHNGLWRGENPLKLSVPLVFMQLVLVISFTRLYTVVLRPIRIPRFIAEVLAGLTMGPSALGGVAFFTKVMFPLRSLKTMETLGNLGLLYFLFLLGLEMDLTTIFRSGKKALTIALSGTLLPLGLGAASIFYLESYKRDLNQWSYLFGGITLTVTSFPVLTLILADLKLLHTDMGRMALASAIINDVFTWLLLAVAMGIVNNKGESYKAFLWITAFVVFCLYVVRPVIKWLLRKGPEGETYGEFHACVILTGVLVCGLAADSCGMYSFVGAFVFGLIMPHGEIGVVLVERLEDAVSLFLLPLFFAIIGMRTHLGGLKEEKRVYDVVGVVVFACLAKFMSTLLAAFFYDMELGEGMALGVLMNTKGIMALVVLHVAKEQLVFDDLGYAVMLVAILIMTALVTPITSLIYKPSRRFTLHKLRTIQSLKPDAEFRILTCIHETRNVQGILNLIEASNATRWSPIFVFVLHLIELTGRTSAMLIVQTMRKSEGRNVSRAQAESENIINAFLNYEQETGGVSVQPLTALSPYPTMDEDICNLAEDKRVAFIIVPFHKHLTIDGKMKEAHPAYRGINRNVLQKSPCSVGIFVDRGLGATPLTTNVSYRVAMLYVVGRDDREALSYAWRMTGHPGVSLDVVRFLPGEDAVDIEAMDVAGHSDGILSIITDYEREKNRDDAYIKEFKIRTSSDRSITYQEEVVNSGEDMVSVIRAMDHNHDLYIVGRGQGVVSPLTAGLSAWTDNPELGAVGDVLVSSDFAASVSVLVVQQYAGILGYAEDGGLETLPDRLPHPGRQEFNNSFEHMNWRPPVAENDGLELSGHLRR